MLELGGDADLAQEALAGDGGHDARAHDLDGDLAAELAVACPEDRRHAAPPRLALHDVAIAERLFQHRQQIAHRVAVGQLHPGHVRRARPRGGSAPGSRRARSS